MKNHSRLCEYAFYGNECPDLNCRLEHPKLHIMQEEKKTSKQFDLGVWIDNWIGGYLIHQPESK